MLFEPRPPASGRTLANDAGQMMLLAAVVLVVAFLALSVMVGRISTIEGQTLRDVDNSLLDEAEALRRGVCAAFEVTGDTGQLQSLLEVLGLQLAGRAFHVTWPPWPLAADDTLTLTLRHGASAVSFTVVESDC